MPERVNSFALLLPAAFFVFVSTITVYSSARAESPCIEQPGQQAPEGTHWNSRYDRPKGRKCWFLADANGRDVTALLPQPGAAPTPDPMQTLSSQLAALFGNSTAASANVAPQATAPQSNPANAPRKPPGNTANANKTDNAVRADQRGASEGNAVKRTSLALTQQERNALFEEFMRWLESQENVTALKPWPSTR
jgi:hypothetical protein